MNSLEIKKIAFHEAGHYVQGYIRGLPLCGIVMVPNTDAFQAAVETCDIQGWIDCAHGTDRLSRLKDSIAFKLAGQIAERFAVGKSATIGQDLNDLAHINQFRQQIRREFPDEDQQQLMPPLDQHVKQNMHNTAIWAAVTALANRLSENRDLMRTEARALLSNHKLTVCG